MLDADILAIAPEGARFIANTVLVPKAQSGQEFRLCVNFRNLNSKTVRDNFAMPHVTDALDRLAPFEWYSLLDLKAGYHNIPIEPQS